MKPLTGYRTKFKLHRGRKRIRIARPAKPWQYHIQRRPWWAQREGS